ncbi:MAG: Ppx/GppA family phosphatase [Alphaproteobacteria bacterium]
MSGILSPGRSTSGGRGKGSVAAVIDIGSNSIRLVVYGGPTRALLPVFNEKVLCGLGRDLDATGRLHPPGVKLALESLARFVALLQAMPTRRIEVVATAAVREASDGAAFVEEVERRTGLSVRVVSGEEEGRLSALGVLAGLPEVDGVIGDLGGGSVELVNLASGAMLSQTTLPIGPLRLGKGLATSDGRRRKLIDQTLGSVPWLAAGKGRPFYAVGGAWRELARIHMSQTAYPLHIIHHYGMPAGEAVEFCNFIARLSGASLERIPDISKQRVEVIPYAATLLGRLLSLTGASSLVFSAYGLREGCLFDRLPKAARGLDPLIEACRGLSQRMGRQTADGDALFNWMTPLFPDETAGERRLRRAACQMADIGWSEHPDYRAEHVLIRILRHPLPGIDHRGRAFTALAVASRHATVEDELLHRYAGRLLDSTLAKRARVVGTAMRLAYTYSGGVTALLRPMTLRRDGKVVTMIVPQDDDTLVGDAVGRRFIALASLLDCEARIVTYDPPAQRIA